MLVCVKCNIFLMLCYLSTKSSMKSWELEMSIIQGSYKIILSVIDVIY